MPPAADPAFLSVVAARDAIRAGTLTPTALTDACLARIRALDPQLEAWIHVDEAGARAEAARRTEEAKAGQWRGPLHGIPVGIKDIFDVAGMPTTAGARPWAHTRPVRDAASVQLLRAKGAVILGKTHTTQFAFRDPAPTRNPWHSMLAPAAASARTTAWMLAATSASARATSSVARASRIVRPGGISASTPHASSTTRTSATERPKTPT